MQKIIVLIFLSTEPEQVYVAPECVEYGSNSFKVSFETWCLGILHNLTLEPIAASHSLKLLLKNNKV